MLLIVLLSCDENKNEDAKQDLDRAGRSIEKTVEKSKHQIKEAVQEVKHDTTIKKIGEKIKRAGDRITH